MESIALAATLLTSVLGATPATPAAPDTSAPRWVADTGG